MIVRSRQSSANQNQPFARALRLLDGQFTVGKFFSAGNGTAWRVSGMRFGLRSAKLNRIANPQLGVHAEPLRMPHAAFGSEARAPLVSARTRSSSRSAPPAGCKC